VLLFALGISVITGVVFGIAPAWMASRTEPIEALRGANRTVPGRRGALGTAAAQSTLVIVQAAVSLVLLSAAAMLGQSLRNREHQNFGFDTSGRYRSEERRVGKECRRRWGRDNEKRKEGEEG